MNAGDLLSELRDNILRDRSTIVSGPSDRLWSDESLMRYINEAYFLFARRSMTLVDKTTPAVTQIVLRADVRDYPLHPSIVEVLSARLASAQYDMIRAAHALLDSPENIPPSLVVGYQPIARLVGAAPRAFTVDEDSATFRVHPTPDSVFDRVKVLLRVARKPLTRLSLDRLDECPEVPEEYHLPMLDWAAYLALSNHDADAESLNRASLRQQSFERTIAQSILDTRRRRRPAAAWRFNVDYAR